MSKPFYSDYVRHAMRFYSRNTDGNMLHFISSADYSNWLSCRNALMHYSSMEREMFISIYGGDNTLSKNVYQASKNYKTDVNKIWDMMKEFERKIARERGLI